MLVLVLVLSGVGIELHLASLWWLLLSFVCLLIHLCSCILRFLSFQRSSSVDDTLQQLPMSHGPMSHGPQQCLSLPSKVDSQISRVSATLRSRAWVSLSSDSTNPDIRLGPVPPSWFHVQVTQPCDSCLTPSGRQRAWEGIHSSSQLCTAES